MNKGKNNSLSLSTRRGTTRKLPLRWAWPSLLSFISRTTLRHFLYSSHLLWWDSPAGDTPYSCTTQKCQHCLGRLFSP